MFWRNYATLQLLVTAKGPVTLDLSLPEHILGWKRQKEAIASEPTGLAFSHYKALAQDPMLAEIDRFLLNLPYRQGFSPDAWQFYYRRRDFEKVRCF
jgi:hypothetical protein